MFGRKRETTLNEELAARAQLISAGATPTAGTVATQPAQHPPLHSATGKQPVAIRQTGMSISAKRALAVLALIVVAASFYLVFFYPRIGYAGVTLNTVGMLILAGFLGAGALMLTKNLYRWLFWDRIPHGKNESKPSSKEAGKGLAGVAMIIIIVAYFCIALYDFGMDMIEGPHTVTAVAVGAYDSSWGYRRAPSHKVYMQDIHGHRFTIDLGGDSEDFYKLRWPVPKKVTYLAHTETLISVEPAP